MSEPPRLRRVEEIYHEALARGPAERDAYLQAECGSDMSLLEEVKSLLGYEGEARHLLTPPRPRRRPQQAAPTGGVRETVPPGGGAAPRPGARVWARGTRGRPRPAGRDTEGRRQSRD